MCNDQGGTAICTCLPEYVGNPYETCRPECTINSDCATNLACIRYKCQNPCLGTCGTNADCQVVRHLPTCTCAPGYTGDPFSFCNMMPLERKYLNNITFLNNLRTIIFKLSTAEQIREPCNPSPCGPNSQCRSINNRASCSCLPEFIGNPPNCKPECIISSECPTALACIRQKCQDPCAGTCGRSAQCRVINHSPICSCPTSMTGDPFINCFPTRKLRNIILFQCHSKFMHF